MRNMHGVLLEDMHLSLNCNLKILYNQMLVGYGITRELKGSVLHL